MASETKALDVLEQYNITLENEMFCQYYSSPSEFFGNGVQSYAAAYGVDLTDARAYSVAKSRASQLLTNLNVLRRINDLLDSTGLNDTHVDKQLFLIINQNADFHAKLGAIKEFNKLRNRIVDRIEHTVRVPITAINIMPAPHRVLEERMPDISGEIVEAPVETDAANDPIIATHGQEITEETEA